jgi:nitroreductase
MVVLAIRANLSETDIDRHVARVSEVRGQTVESLGKYRQTMLGSLTDPPFDINEWAARQVYIALGQFMACAALMGVDTCPMEGIDPVKYDEVLGIGAQGYRTVVGCAAGYRSPADRSAQLPKVRFKTEDVVQVI